MVARLKAPFQGRKSWQGVLTAVTAAPVESAEMAEAPDAWSLVFMDGKAEQVLGFKLEEVREARLVPVVDFKGRTNRSNSADGSPADAAPDQAPVSGSDGG